MDQGLAQSNDNQIKTDLIVWINLLLGQVKHNKVIINDLNIVLQILFTIYPYDTNQGFRY